MPGECGNAVRSALDIGQLRPRTANFNTRNTILMKWN